MTRNIDAQGFIKNQDTDGSGYILACRILGMLLKDKGERPAYFKEHIDGKFAIDEIYRISRMNNVIMRVMDSVNGTGDNDIILKWKKIMQEERSRCDRSVGLINAITKSFEEDSIRYAIIKTLDSYPDFGNDVDIFIDAPFKKMKDWVSRKHKGFIRKRKITEVMCGKMSVEISGHPLLELHCERMGQVGEEPALAESIIKSRRLFEGSGFKAYVSSREEQIVIITIHRLYRHLSFKISDIVNAIAILKAPDFKWDRLFKLAGECGVTDGVEYLLGILENVHIAYTGNGFLPDAARERACMNAKLSYRHFFLRISLFRVPPRLYMMEAASFLVRGKFGSLARLSLVPALSCIAYTTIKLFKDDWVW